MGKRDMKIKPITITEELRELLDEGHKMELQAQIHRKKIERLVTIHHGFPIVNTVKRVGDKIITDKTYRATELTPSQQNEMVQKSKCVFEDMVIEKS